MRVTSLPLLPLCLLVVFGCATSASAPDRAVNAERAGAHEQTVAHDDGAPQPAPGFLAADVPVAVPFPPAVQVRAKLTGHTDYVDLGVNERGYREFLRRRDGMICVLVPEGWFIKRELFSLPDPLAKAPDAWTGRRMFVPRFLIDKHEITNAQVARFIATRDNLATTDGTLAGPDGEPWAITHEWGLLIGDGPDAVAPQPGYENHPAVGCSGHLALAYAQWVNGDLPVGYEYEKAAAGPSGLLFPWGDETAMPDSTRCNYMMDGPRCTMRVGSYPLGASPYGCFDMAGNVYERAYWGGDDAAEDTPVAEGVVEHGPPTMLKGGGWVSPHWFNLRCVCRCGQPVEAMEGSVGFRTVTRERAVLDAVAGGNERLRIVTNPFDAFSEAAERNVPIFLFLGYSGCGQCDRMRAELFTDRSFIDYCNEKLVVVVGHDPRGENYDPLPVDPNGMIVPYPDFEADALRMVFWFFSYMNADVPESVSQFRISPGLSLLNPHQELYETPNDMLLVGEDAFAGHKNGGDLEVILELFREAQAMLGEGMTRSAYLDGAEPPETAWTSPGAPEDDDDDDDD